MDWPGRTTIVSDVQAEAAVLEQSAIPSPAAHAAMMSLRMLPPCSRGTPREQESGSPQPGIPSLWCSDHNHTGRITQPSTGMNTDVPRATRDGRRESNLHGQLGKSVALRGHHLRTG